MKASLKLGMLAIGLATSTLAGAAELGRIFFTPEQRAKLDHRYAQGTDSDSNSPVLILNGIVQQHGGKRTVWINGVPQPGGSSDDRTPASQTVQLPGKSSTVKLKVGQHILLDTPASPDLNNAPDASRQ